jgi:outer membrane receptor protein involved in Fe transport
MLARSGAPRHADLINGAYKSLRLSKQGGEMNSTISNPQGFARGAIAVLATALIGLPALAQDDADGTEIEEVVVYAQKRAQNIMDVPVAVTAVSGAQIEASGIKDVFDLQQNVPSLAVGQSQAATTSNFSIRGLGSTSNNFGVESSVGLYVDGVYRSRQSSIINELVDLEAVEVLRGPQGTLFGKNTAAGAIQIRSVAPSQTPDAFVDFTAGDFGLARFSAATNIPLNDRLAFRGTIFASQRDGYVDDDNFGSDVHNDRDRFGTRLQVGYEGDNDFDVRVILDYAKIDEVCCVGVSRVDSLYSRASLSGVPQPGTDTALLALGGTIFTDYPYPDPFLQALAPLPGTVVTGVGFDQYRVKYDTLPDSENEDRGLSVEFNKTFDNGLTLTSISAYRAFDTFDLIDVDFTDVPLLTRTNDAAQQSFSQEFRLAGEFGENSNFVAGAYYFGQEIDQVTFIDAPAFDPASGIPPLPGLPLSFYLSNNPGIIAVEAGVNQVAAIFGPSGAGLPYAPSGAPIVPGSQATDNVLQEHDGWAAFFQTDIGIGENFVLTLGGRYTDESKDITATYTQNLPYVPANVPNLGLMGVQLCSLDPACAATLPMGAPVFDPVGSVPVFAPFAVDGWGIYVFAPLAPRADLAESISDDQFTGNAKLTWFVTDEVMLYGAYSTGFKAGGTNTDRIDPSFSQIFRPETAKSAEIGMKGDFGPLRVAVAIYDTQFEDFQANTFTGTGFYLQNAGDVDTQGFEIEFNWRITDWLNVDGWFARNEGEYKSFVEGVCQDAFQFHTGMPDPGLPADFNPILDTETCDRSGGRLPYNSEDRFFVGLTTDFPVGNNNLFIRAEYSSASDLLTDGDLDPFDLQDDFSTVNLRLGLDITGWNSTVTLWGRNVTDERYYVGSFDPPAQSGRVNSYPAEPATYGITFRKNWD